MQQILLQRNIQAPRHSTNELPKFDQQHPPNYAYELFRSRNRLLSPCNATSPRIQVLSPRQRGKKHCHRNRWRRERVRLEADDTRRTSRHARIEHELLEKYSEDYSNYNHWRANEILREAVGLVHFVSADDNDRGAISMHRTGPHPCALRTDQAGVPSDVIIGGYVYREMLKTRCRIDAGVILNGQERAQLLYCQFEFARLVLHELAHALETLYTGVRRWEDHYEATLLSERGYNIEAAVSGGGLVSAAWSRGLLSARTEEYCNVGRCRPQATIPAVLLYSWPSRSWLDRYRCRKQKTGVCQMHEVPITTVHRVPFRFIEGVFSNEYWDAVARSRHKSLIVPSLSESWVVCWSGVEDGICPLLSIAGSKTAV